MRSLALLAVAAAESAAVGCAQECVAALHGDAVSFKQGCGIKQDGTPYVATQDDVDEWCSTATVFHDCTAAVDSVRACMLQRVPATKGEGCCAADACVGKYHLAKG